MKRTKWLLIITTVTGIILPPTIFANLPVTPPTCSNSCECANGGSGESSGESASSGPGNSGPSPFTSKSGIGSMYVNINFGSPANESINTISQFSIYSKEPTPAIYTPQTLQYRNYLLERISQRVVNKNFEAQITGSTGSISGSDQEGGFGRQSLSTDLPSNVTHQVKIFTKNREMLIFEFYENNPVGKLTGKNFTDGYLLKMVDSSGNPTTGNPAYYDFCFTNGNFLRFSTSTWKAVSYHTVTGRIITPDAPSVGLEAIYDQDGIIRQIWSLGDGLADVVVTEAAVSYEIRFYAPNQIGDKVDGVYTTTGEPYGFFRIENPNPGSSNRVKVTKSLNQAAEVTLFEYSPTTEGWLMKTPDDLMVESQSTVWNSSRTSKTITSVRKTADGQVAARDSSTFQDFAFGTRVMEVIDAPDGAKRKTSYSYYTDSGNPGSYGRQKTASYPNGSWNYFEYDAQGREILRVSPWKNSAFNSPANQARAEYLSYAPVDSRDVVASGDTRPRTEETRILGITVRKTYHAYYFDEGAYVEVHEQCISPTAAFGDASNLRTEKRYYPGGSCTSPSAGRIHTIKYPNGTMDAYTYEYGNWQMNGGDLRGSFTAGSGNAVRMTVTHGTVASPAGIAGKSTSEDAIYDARGCKVLVSDKVYTGNAYEESTWTAGSYDQQRRKVKDWNSNGEIAEYTWNCCSKESETLADGTQYTYAYDAMKRLVAKTRVGIGNQPNYVTTYAYDAASRVISETITGGNLSTTATYTYNTAGQPVTVVDHQGLVTTYAYENGVNTGSQCHGEVVTKTLPGGFKSIQATYCDGQVSAITGDAQVAQYYDYGINADSSQWGMEYSAQADSPRWQKTTVNMLSQVQKKERSGYNGTVTESYTYNDKAQAVKVSKTGSADMLIVYDELGNQIRSGYDLDESGALEATSNDLIIDLAQTYEKIDSDWWQTQTQSTYATAGSNTATVIQIQKKRLSGFSGMLVGETQQTDVWGNTVSSFTMLDRETKQVTRNITHPDSSVQEQTVTVNGLTVSNRSKSNQTATYSYDGLRRLSSVTEARVGTTSITYHTEAGKIGLRACVTDPAGNTTTYDYDSSSGRLLWEKNALNQYTRYAYNSFGRQTMIWGDTQYPVTLGYDAYGQQISLKTYRTGDAWNSASWPGASLAGDQTTWTYDAASGLVTAKTDAAGNATTYTYTTDGRLASRTWARQVNGEPLVTTFSYNALGSLLKVDYSDATPDITITYNRIGQPVTVQDAAGTRNFAYNANLGLISETVSGIYNKTLTRTYTTAFGKGKVLSMSIGNVNNYTYDYDTYGRLNKIATPAGDFTYTRPSDSDLVTAMARPNNVTSNWTFEEHRNLLSQVANGSVSTYTYTNDALGRRTNLTRSGSAFSDTNILTYGYNSRSEVISALSNINANYNFAYSYDPIGNRLNSTLAGTAWNYTSNNLNQYTALTSGNTTQSPAYDADGNMTFRDGWTQIWNGENRLVEMYNDTAKLTFSYDYMGRRIEKKVFQQTGGIWAPQKSLQYVYDGYKLVEEIDTLPDEKPVIRRYTWQPESQGADLPLVVTDVASGQSYFYIADGNKNISELVDAAGNIAAHYEYDPFGKINTQNGAYAASNPFRFSSEYFDSETGLVYYNYRYYSPQMGRWINRDPIQEKGGWNLYAMVGNNTINRKDRLGNMATPISEPIECTKILSQLDARYKAFDRAKARRSIFNDDWTNILLETSEFSPLSLPELGAFLMDKARELLSGQLLSLGFAHPDPLIDLVQDTIIGTMLSGPLKELLNNAGMNTFPNEPCRNALHELGINMELYAKAETLRAWWENWENFTSAYKEICPCTTNTELQKIQKYKEHWTENTNLMKKYLEQSHKKAVSLCR